jgi:hypothetical protein
VSAGVRPEGGIVGLGVLDRTNSAHSFLSATVSLRPRRNPLYDNPIPYGPVGIVSIYLSCIQRTCIQQDEAFLHPSCRTLS